MASAVSTSFSNASALRLSIMGNYSRYAIVRFSRFLSPKCRSLFQYDFPELRGYAAFSDEVYFFTEKLLQISFHPDELDKARDISLIEFNEDVAIASIVLLSATKDPKMPISLTLYFRLASSLCFFNISLISSILLWSFSWLYFINFVSYLLEFSFQSIMWRLPQRHGF